MSSTYLQDLTIRLATGLGSLSQEERDRHARFLLSSQRPDGGFAGREGGSDLYYTGFALRGIALLGELQGDVAEQAAQYIRQRLTSEAPIIDFLSLIYSATLLNMAAGLDVFDQSTADWRANVATALEAFRREDGGYAKGPEGVASSTYHSFLVVLCLQMIDRAIPQPEKLRDFILGQQRDDGGFVEIRAMRRSGTNPTAAAIGLLQILGELDTQVQEEVIDFLLDMQTDEGGLRANTRIPIADLLSTFTGMLTLADLQAVEDLDLGHLAQYVDSMQVATGGFRGAAWDEATDVEYTFYGLGSLALLQLASNNSSPSD